MDVRHITEKTHVRKELPSASGVILLVLNSVLMRQHHSASKRENRDLHDCQEVVGVRGMSFWRVVMCVTQIGKEKKDIVEGRIVRQKPNKSISTRTRIRNILSLSQTVLCYK